ncbi:TolC family protein [Pararcticibacter amylolyticus]|uniref:Transporter n=1 Tax=Pararcticibacter amylolyticus TaxID=2173175 RepID=A0A2U2PJ14_9SPHI|nr:TolC family protein [Pararcticibacter amylolyticus]PWG81385.1 hypothetical protein DDR33_05965 [Pararcticibacter amylolyticus]
MKYLRSILYLLLMINAEGIVAQTHSLSLQEAITLGLKNRNDLKSHEYDVLISENQLKASRKEWIPDLAGSADARYNARLSQTVVPAGMIGNAEPMKVSLESKTNSVYALNLSQPLLNPSITNDIRIAKNNVALQKERRNISENEIRLAITESYLNVLLKDVQYKLTRENEKRYYEYLQMAEGKYKLGAMIENDYLKARLDYQNAVASSKTREKDYDLAFNELKYQMNVPRSETVVIRDSIQSVFIASPLPQESIAGENRPEIKQLKLLRENAALQIRKARQNALPSISLYASYGHQFQYKNFDYSNRDWWTPYSYAGLKVSIPLTFNLKNNSTISEHQLRSVQAGFDLEQGLSDVRFEVSQALARIATSSYNLEKSRANYELSKAIFLSNQKQFKLGVFQYAQVLESERTIATSEENYIQSIYDALMARYYWMKATGTFPVAN